MILLFYILDMAALHTSTITAKYCQLHQNLEQQISGYQICYAENLFETINFRVWMNIETFNV